jgi:hypothetical protein
MISCLEFLAAFDDHQITCFFCTPQYYDKLVKSHEFNYRWLSKKVHIQGVVFFQERGHTSSMPSV